MSQEVNQGYFLLADLSGFTAFLADSELDHAKGIIEQVLEAIVANLTPTMTLGEVEGDAVYVYGVESQLSRGELIAELVEATYVAFRDLQKTMLRNATCPCRACQSIDELDLKFVIHFGEFALRDVAGKRAPIGSSVNVAHRLVKNHTPDATGWRAYVLISEQALAQMGLSPEGLHASEEKYEHLGNVRTFSNDLHQFYDEVIERRRVALTAEEAHAEIVHDFDMPPAIVWDWLNDPAKRTRWMQRSNWIPDVRIKGRTAPGAKNHCASFEVIEQILDWRPFDYYTVRFLGGPLSVLATVSLESLMPGTRVRWKMKVENRLPRWIGKLLSKALITRRMRLAQGFDSMTMMMHQV
ncbi:hypothetical protein D1BOALGB6SA_9672 [Olavius sp. associated proteobacterium Delta 1]|nr:hypothetical protein D1BOALGB6SA_9672 [Olavius sp. associated proteobacterium Delta 1]